MSLFVIARILEENKIVALKLYDDATKKSTVHLMKEVNELILHNPDIAGFTVKTCIDYYNLTEKQSIRLSYTKMDNVAALPILNGYGEPFGKKPTKVVVGVIGFGEARRYKLIDYKGNETVVLHQEFIRLVKDNAIVGAAECKNGEIKIHKKCFKRYIE